MRQSWLFVARERLEAIAEIEAKGRERDGEIARLNGMVDACEREVSALALLFEYLQFPTEPKEW